MNRDCTWKDFAFFSPREQGVLAIAHRGSVEDGRENNLETFLSVAQLGIRFLEIDVRGTTLDRLVLWHGKGAERLRPGRPVEDDLAVANGCPTLDEVTFSLPDDMHFFLDIKNEAAVPLTVNRVVARQLVDRVCIGSFSHARTLAVAEGIYADCGKRPATALTPRQVLSLMGASYIRRSRDFSIKAVSAQIPAWLAKPRVIDAAHKAGMLVLPWTVNEPAQMQALLDIGVDGMMTDRPSLLGEIIASRLAS